MRVLIFHGYLLDGTGSNVYNARLAAALVAAGHEVHLLAQERHGSALPFVDAIGSWQQGALTVAVHRQPVRCTLYRPPIGSLLPVYVYDRYEGFVAKRFSDCTDDELERYIAANVAATAEVCARSRAEAALANHLVMGPAILARALPATVPYAVKIHGSALEYTVKAEPGRFLPYAREGLAPARAILLGSSHTARSLAGALCDPELERRMRLLAPGVDTELFAPLPDQPGARARAYRALLEALERQCAQARGAQGDGDGFAQTPALALAAVRALDPERDLPIAFVGKLIAAKGAELALRAFAIVQQQLPAARLFVVGFGELEADLQKLVEAGRAGDGPLAGAAERIHFTGRLQHAQLAPLLALCSAVVVPSVFPEAFGMIVAEAAAAGALPVSADHSGLAEVSGLLGAAVDEMLHEKLGALLRFPIEQAPEAIAQRLLAWLELPESLRAQARAALIAAVRERFSWAGVAAAVLAAAQGRIETLSTPELAPRALEESPRMR